MSLERISMGSNPIICEWGGSGTKTVEKIWRPKAVVKVLFYILILFNLMSDCILILSFNLLLCLILFFIRLLLLLSLITQRQKLLNPILTEALNLSPALGSDDVVGKSHTHDYVDEEGDGQQSKDGKWRCIQTYYCLRWAASILIN